MKQKLIALAIASALSAPAFADNANVEVYGKAFLTLDSHNDGTNTVMRVNTNASRFGVKGSDDLGDGLKGIFQYEVEMDADGASATGGLGKSRNSGFGLEGDFGKVVLGIWDSPYKVTHNKIELFDNTTSWSAVKTIGKDGSDKDYNTRQKNMIQYWSPKGPVQVGFMYSPDEAKTSTSNKSILSMSATFAQDNIYAAVGYESRGDQKTVGQTDSAFRVVGKFDLADAWVGGMIESMKSNNTATTSLTSKNFELVGGVKLGAGSLAATYAKKGDSASGAADNVTALAVKYAYNFSKRTEGFVAYGSRKDNAINKTATTFGGGFLHKF